MNAKLQLGLPHLLGREFTEEVNFNEAELEEPTFGMASSFRTSITQKNRNQHKGTRY